jgi:hypothetical protein
MKAVKYADSSGTSPWKVSFMLLIRAVRGSLAVR